MVLNRYPWGESDLLVVLLSPSWGRFSAIAKGARRSQRRFVNTLEPLFLLKTHLRTSKTGLIPFLDQADVLCFWENIFSHPRRFVLASYFSELVEVFSKPKTGQEFFPLLKSSLEVLNNQDPFLLLKLTFEIKLLSEAGFSPLLEKSLAWTPQETSLLKTLIKFSWGNLKKINISDEILKKISKKIEKFLLGIIDQDINSLKICKEFQLWS